jgi:hypothetical protein
MKKFSELFRKYRLRSEFETFAAFGDALSEKGYFYEESIFSHWQKGSRVPTNRHLVLKIAEVFIERGAMTTLESVNELLNSVGMGYLTDDEKEELGLHNFSNVPFQVPGEIFNFTGREEIIANILKEINTQKTFLLYGLPGVGKTALAIKIGHILREKFYDGVLWYKVDSSNVMDILLSIARLFGEDIANIRSVDVRASIVRTLLGNRKLLLIFDNVREADGLHLLLSGNDFYRVIFTSRENFLDVSNYGSMHITTFTDEEVLQLFKRIFGASYTLEFNKSIVAIGKKMGGLPLAVHLAAAYLKKFEMSPEEYLEKLETESVDLQKIVYDNKNLFKAISISFEKLDVLSKSIFISLGVFEGKDFSIDAIAYVNKLSVREAKKILDMLQVISFVEKSVSGRYRVHPLLKLFARGKMLDNSLYLRAAFYYEKLLNQAEESNSYKKQRADVDNIIYVFKKCYEAGYWDQIITLWNPIERFLSNTNELKKLGSLMKMIDTSKSVNNLQKIFTGYIVVLLFYWLILTHYQERNSFISDSYSLFLSFIPFFGGMAGVFRSKYWGLFKSNIGKAVLYLSFGLFSWGCGNLIWAYYNYFENVDIPYPSLADIGYFPAYFLWLAGVFYLSKATGTRFDFGKKRGKLFLLVIPSIIFLVSYYFLFVVSRRTFEAETPIRVFFDLYYPFMNIIILTLAVIILGLAANFFGGKYKFSITLLLTGFVVLYMADFTFSYTTSQGLYFTGNYVDLLFSIAHYLISWGTLSFYLTPKRK